MIDVENTENNDAPVHVIKQLKSSYLTTLIFAYAFDLDHAFKTLNVLNKSGGRFLRQNLSQLRSFCVSPPLPELVYKLNETCFQRPIEPRLV